jgi:hypothetical protein
VFAADGREGWVKDYVKLRRDISREGIEHQRYRTCVKWGEAQVYARGRSVSPLVVWLPSPNCGHVKGSPSRHAHIYKNEESPSIINPGMTIEGNGDTLEQDIADSPQECSGDDAENITTDMVPINDQPSDLESQNESDQSKPSHQGNSHQMLMSEARRGRLSARSRSCCSSDQPASTPSLPNALTPFFIDTRLVARYA